MKNSTSTKYQHTFHCSQLLPIFCRALLCFLMFGGGTAWALTLGEGANDAVPTTVRNYANVQAWLNNTARDANHYITINNLRYFNHQLLDFHDRTAGGLTDENFIKEYANTQAYIDDPARASSLYAQFLDRKENGQSSIYNVALLEAYRINGQTIPDAIPRDILFETLTTAVGDNSKANATNATAFGAQSRALGADSTALGEQAYAPHFATTAIGDHAEAYGRYSTAIGRYAHTGNSNSTAIGARASSVETNTVAVGMDAVASGSRSVVVGAGAYAGKNKTMMGAFRVSDLLDCANGNHSRAIFIRDCSGLMTPAEKANPLLADTSRDGLVFRDSIRARWRQALKDNGTMGATAIGGGSQVAADFASAFGDNAQAMGVGSLAIGANAVANGKNSIAIGHRVAATANQVVIGNQDNHYRLPGATAKTGKTGVLSVNDEGEVSVRELEDIGGGQYDDAELRNLIGGNTTDIATNKDNIDINTNNITTNKTDIATNTTNIESNTTDIGANTTNITTNTTNIGANKTNITTNKTNIAENKGKITEIDGNLGDKTENSDDYDGNATAFSRIEWLRQNSTAGGMADVSNRVTKNTGDIIKNTNEIRDLGARVDQATALASALSAVPNVVPGNNNYHFGIGFGNYRNEQAIAIGISARKLTADGNQIFLNFGSSAVLGGGGSDSVVTRVGVGWAW